MKDILLRWKRPIRGRMPYIGKFFVDRFIPIKKWVNDNAKESNNG